MNKQNLRFGDITKGTISPYFTYFLWGYFITKIQEFEIAENVFYFLKGKRNLLDKWKHLSGD